jgi:hypothetical protein
VRARDEQPPPTSSRLPVRDPSGGENGSRSLSGRLPHAATQIAFSALHPPHQVLNCEPHRDQPKEEPPVLVERMEQSCPKSSHHRKADFCSSLTHISLRLHQRDTAQ